MSKLTPKQEAFCLAYIETGNASEAYRQAYDCSKMSNEAINVEATKLLNNPKIALRVDELQTAHRERHKITVDELIEELEQARAIAKEKGNATAMVSATMGKAKLLGLDKLVIDSAIDNELPTKINIVFTDETDDQEKES